MMVIRSKIAFLILAAVLLASAALGQSADRASLESIDRANTMGVKPVANPFSLLDFSKITWSHSYSVGYFSGGSSSGTSGLLNSSMLYEISPSLSLTLNIGIAHSNGIYESGDNANLLPGFALDYHPSDKFRMSLIVQRYAGYPFGSAWGSTLWHDRYGLGP